MIARRCVILRSLDEQPVHRLDVVADRHHRKPRTVKRLRRIARRRRVAVAEQLRRDEEQRRGVERAAGPDQPLVAVVLRHVVRRQQHGVVARGVEMAVRAVDDARLRQRDAAFRVKVVDRRTRDARRGRRAGPPRGQSEAKAESRQGRRRRTNVCEAESWLQDGASDAGRQPGITTTVERPAPRRGTAPGVSYVVCHAQ